MSPVPGGMSITSTSRSPQSARSINWVKADAAIGPRQITAFPGSVIMPIDRVLSPQASTGWIRLAIRSARTWAFIRVGTDGP